MSGEEHSAEEKAKPRRMIGRTFLIFGGSILLLLGVAIVGAGLWLDSDGGRRFVAGQVEGLEREDGMRIKIGEIKGSIFGKTELHDLELHDPKGLFFKAGQVSLDWSPLAWIFNELNINSAVVAKARLERFPELIDSGKDQPLLPDFDIYVGSFRADNMSLGKAITGEEQRADLSGAVDITSGRAMINLDAATTRSGDKLNLVLNAEPDREKLDLNADIVAPAGGVIANYLGLARDMVLRLKGDGDWQKWDGSFLALSGEEQLAAASLEARDGLFGFDGSIANDLLPDGMARRLALPRLVFNGTTTLEDGLADLDVAARSGALALTAQGGVDLARSSLDALRVETQVRNPSAILSNMKAQDLELNAILNGKFSELRYQYLLTAPQLAFGKSLLMGVRAEGQGQRDAGGWDIPVELSASSLIGNGTLAKRMVSGFDGKAFLRYEQGVLFADNAGFRTDSLTGKADIEVRPATGHYAINVDAQAPAFFIEGLGISDILASVNLKPGSGGLSLGGKVTARLRRFDNSFLRGLGGGLPVLETGLALGPEGYLRFPDLEIKAPEVSFKGSGSQTGATTFSFDGTGRHDQYGSFDLALDGPLTRPQVALLLDSPLPAAGLSQVRVLLDPAANGFAYKASGGSTLGPFDSNGAIVVGNQMVVRVDRLLVSDTLATGIVRPTSAGLAGDLKISGGGVNGSVRFEPGTNRQLIRANLVAKNARFRGDPPIFIRTGALDADIVLVDGRSNIDATVRAQGVSRGELVVGRIAGSAKLTGGSGTATFSVAGTRGSTFEFQARAQVAPDRYVLNGNGIFEGRRLRLSRPLELRRVSGGWTASPTTLTYGSGSARFSGRWGSGSSSLDLNMSKMPLSLIDIAYDDLGLGGLAYGSVKLTQSGSRTPVGSAKLTIKGLTRSGLILTSTPVDLGLNLAISSRNAAARGVIKSTSGKTIGRFQGRVTDLGGGNWQNELMRNPLFAEARFNGAADSLWRLTGIETFDLTGPVAVNADVGGTLANPQIRGQLRTTNARLESGLTGTVISGIKASGRFNGSRLVLPNITGVTRGGGSVSGSGNFNFAVEPGVGVGITMDINAKNAQLIARDDFAGNGDRPDKNSQ